MGFRFLVYVLACLVASFAQTEDCYNPWRAEQRAARAKLSPSYRCPFEGPALNARGFAVSYADGRFTIGGRDRTGQRWSIRSPMGSCDQVWIQDFDRNGQLDLLITGSSGAAGVRPSSYLLFIMVDSTGQPIPWLTYTYSSSSDGRRSDLLDLNQDGRLEVLVASHGHADVGSYSYWTHTLYEARDALWHMVKGTHGPISYPVHSKYTFDCHNLPAFFAAGLEPVVFDGSNSGLASAPLTLLSMEPPIARSNAALVWSKRRGEGDARYHMRTAFESNPKLALSDGRACAMAWSVSLLLSQSGHRTWRPALTEAGVKPENSKLLRDALAHQWPVRVAASVEKGFCFIRHLWIEQP